LKVWLKIFKSFGNINDAGSLVQDVAGYQSSDAVFQSLSSFLILVVCVLATIDTIALWRLIGILDKMNSLLQV
jgi:hypothetical protein